MKIKTSELIGAALDWAVAISQKVCIGEPLHSTFALEFKLMHDSGDLQFSTDWAQGGPIIEREEISIEYGRAEFKSEWIAYKLGLPDEDNPQGGPTPLIAAMRCYVASKLGDEVEIPEELK